MQVPSETATNGGVPVRTGGRSLDDAVRALEEAIAVSYSELHTTQHLH